MPEKVEAYRLAWHPRFGGRLRIRISGQPWSDWVSLRQSELTAAASILREDDVHHQNGWLFTGTEPILDDDPGIWVGS